MHSLTNAQWIDAHPNSILIWITTTHQYWIEKLNLRNNLTSWPINQWLYWFDSVNFLPNVISTTRPFHRSTSFHNCMRLSWSYKGFVVLPLSQSWEVVVSSSRSSIYPYLYVGESSRELPPLYKHPLFFFFSFFSTWTHMINQTPLHLLSFHKLI